MGDNEAGWQAAGGERSHGRRVGRRCLLARGQPVRAKHAFSLGQSHPLYDAFPDPPLYDLDRDGHYSFYVRVPDLPAFLLQVAPVLEERLSNSVAAGHTATLELNFYSSGLRREILHGRINSAELWNPTPENSAFPDLTFLQLLLGHHSLEELSHTFPDCSPSRGDIQVLLKALFSKRPSNLEPVC